MTPLRLFVIAFVGVLGFAGRAEPLPEDNLSATDPLELAPFAQSADLAPETATAIQSSLALEGPGVNTPLAGSFWLGIRLVDADAAVFHHEVSAARKYLTEAVRFAESAGWEPAGERWLVTAERSATQQRWGSAAAELVIFGSTRNQNFSHPNQKPTVDVPVDLAFLAGNWFQCLSWQCDILTSGYDVELAAKMAKGSHGTKLVVAARHFAPLHELPYEAAMLQMLDHTTVVLSVANAPTPSDILRLRGVLGEFRSQLASGLDRTATNSSNQQQISEQLAQARRDLERADEAHDAESAKAANRLIAELSKLQEEAEKSTPNGQVPEDGGPKEGFTGDPGPIRSSADYLKQLHSPHPEIGGAIVAFLRSLAFFAIAATVLYFLARRFRRKLRGD